MTCRRLAPPQAMKNMDWAEVNCNVAHTGTNTFIIFLCNSLSIALMQLIKTDEERNRLELECRLTRFCTSMFKDFKSTCPSVRPSVLYTVKTVSSLLRPYRCEKFICFYRHALKASSSEFDKNCLIIKFLHFPLASSLASFPSTSFNLPCHLPLYPPPHLLFLPSLLLSSSLPIYHEQ